MFSIHQRRNSFIYSIHQTKVVYSWLFLYQHAYNKMISLCITDDLYVYVYIHLTSQVFCHKMASFKKDFSPFDFFDSHLMAFERVSKGQGLFSKTYLNPHGVQLLIRGFQIFRKATWKPCQFAKMTPLQ